MFRFKCLDILSVTGSGRVSPEMAGLLGPSLVPSPTAATLNMYSVFFKLMFADVSYVYIYKKPEFSLV